jgi:hypothetical protein
MGSTGSASRSAFLPEFSHDIFISYAHVDNEPDRPGSEGWVDNFDKLLRGTLFKKLGAEAKIWIDRTDLKKSDKISPTISFAVDSSALFVILLSNRYLQSESCLQEAEWIEDRVNRGSPHPMGNASRIFPVLLYDIPNSERPPICRNMPGFQFYRSESPEDSGYPLDPQWGPEAFAFTEALRKLASELVGRLKKVRSALPPPAAPSPKVVPYRVFMTATPDMRQPQIARLRERLRGDGIDVLDEIVPPPDEMSKHEAALKRILGDVDLTVHLIDEQAGPLVGGTADRYFPEEQCRLAAEQGKQQLVILPELVNLDSVAARSHRLFLDQLQRCEWQGGVTGKTPRFVKARQNETILNLIREERDKARTPVTREAGGTKRVFVDLNSRDLHSVSPLLDFLGKHGLRPITSPTSEVPPGEHWANLVEIVTISQAIIIFYGQAGLEWVTSHVKSAIDLLNEKGLRFRPIVYAAPPVKPLQELEFLKCAVVDCTVDFNEGDLALAVKGATA